MGATELLGCRVTVPVALLLYLLIAALSFQGDLGGQKTLQKRWTTFLKTQLLCSDPETGVVFNILKDVAVLPAENWRETIFLGVFTAER